MTTLNNTKKALSSKTLLGTARRIESPISKEHGSSPRFGVGFVTRDRPAAKFLGSATGSVCAVRERAIAKLLRGAGDSMAAFIAFRGSCPTAKFLGSAAGPI